MYKIEAFFRPAAMDNVPQALHALGIAGLSVLEVRGFGRQRGHREIYRGADYSVDFVPRIKVEVVVKDSDRDAAIDAIVNAAKTGNVGEREGLRLLARAGSPRPHRGDRRKGTLTGIEKRRHCPSEIRPEFSRVQKWR